MLPLVTDTLLLFPNSCIIILYFKTIHKIDYNGEEGRGRRVKIPIREQAEVIENEK